MRLQMWIIGNLLLIVNMHTETWLWSSRQIMLGESCLVTWFARHNSTCVFWYSHDDSTYTSYIVLDIKGSHSKLNKTLVHLLESGDYCDLSDHDCESWQQDQVKLIVRVAQDDFEIKLQTKCQVRNNCQVYWCWLHIE